MQWNIVWIGLWEKYKNYASTRGIRDEWQLETVLTG